MFRWHFHPATTTTSTATTAAAATSSRTTSSTPAAAATSAAARTTRIAATTPVASSSGTSHTTRDPPPPGRNGFLPSYNSSTNSSTSTTEIPAPSTVACQLLLVVSSPKAAEEWQVRVKQYAVFVPPTDERLDSYNITVVNAIRQNDLPTLRALLLQNHKKSNDDDANNNTNHKETTTTTTNHKETTTTNTDATESTSSESNASSTSTSSTTTTIVKKTNFNACNRNGETLLHMACRFGSLEMVQFLIHEARVNVNVIDSVGRTVLHDICWRHQLDVSIMELFTTIIHSDYFLLPDKRGHTCFDYARKEHYAIWNAFLYKHAPTIVQSRQQQQQQPCCPTPTVAIPSNTNTSTEESHEKEVPPMNIINKNEYFYPIDHAENCNDDNEAAIIPAASDETRGTPTPICSTSIQQTASTVATVPTTATPSTATPNQSKIIRPSSSSQPLKRKDSSSALNTLLNDDDHPNGTPSPINTSTNTTNKDIIIVDLLDNSRHTYAYVHDNDEEGLMNGPLKKKSNSMVDLTSSSSTDDDDTIHNDSTTHNNNNTNTTDTTTTAESGNPQNNTNTETTTPPIRESTTTAVSPTITDERHATLTTFMNTADANFSTYWYNGGCLEQEYVDDDINHEIVKALLFE